MNDTEMNREGMDSENKGNKRTKEKNHTTQLTKQ